MEQMRNIFLIGFMGCGKSTVAKELHQMYGLHIIEMDQLIAERQGMSIANIFEQYGELFFRDLESELLGQIQADSKQVISCGGGIVLREKNVAEMRKNGSIVLLTAKPETILSRVSRDDNRPILKGKKTVKDITELMEARREKYEKAADFIVATDNKTSYEIAKEIMQKIGETIC